MKEKDDWNMAGVSALFRGDIENALIAFTPGGIVAQEKAGQHALVNSAMLPKKITNGTREQLAVIGFVFGNDADDLFVNVTLPTGWLKRATDHDMHSELLDDQERVRAGIFYKAAFYDRRADMCFKSFFRIETYYLDKNGNESEWNTAYQCTYNVINQLETVLFTTTPVSRDDWQGQDASFQECKIWLDQQYPNWRNPLAYWE